MADPHPLPPGLEPEAHEHGLASGDLTALAASMDRGWELFEQVAADCDLSAPSRKHGMTGRAIVARLGRWESGRSLEDLLRDAHDGDAGHFDPDEVDSAVIDATSDLPDEEILDGLSAARAASAAWMASDGPATWGLVHTSSPLGPLPLLTVLNAMTYQLAVASLDLEPTGARPPDELMVIGLRALVDTTGALAGRAHFTGSFTAVTPDLIVGVGARNGFWRTADLDVDPHAGPGVEAAARVVLDVTSGRANVPGLYRSGALHVRDLPGLVRLAPVLEGVPGIPPLGAVGKAMSVVDAVGGLLGRLRR